MRFRDAFKGNIKIPLKSVICYCCEGNGFAILAFVENPQIRIIREGIDSLLLRKDGFVIVEEGRIRYC